MNKMENMHDLPAAGLDSESRQRPIPKFADCAKP